jgi:hypothetical protein
MSKPFPNYDMRGFLGDIHVMNETYHLPTPLSPEIPDAVRIAKFKTILLEEINELDDITPPLSNPEHPAYFEEKLDYLVALSDLLADIMVYCTSEARRHGIPISVILFAVMQSNFSKLDVDGKPIHDPKTNKFMKGPNYKPPEERIKQILLSYNY